MSHGVSELQFHSLGIERHTPYLEFIVCCPKVQNRLVVNTHLEKHLPLVCASQVFSFGLNKYLNIVELALFPAYNINYCKQEVHKRTYGASTIASLLVANSKVPAFSSSRYA